MKHPTRWKSLPVDQTRHYLEPGPVVLLSTAHRSERAIMTLGWHMMLGYDLVGTYIWQANRSHALARASRACVINLPTEDLLDTVVRIGNCSSTEQDKFDRFGIPKDPEASFNALEYFATQLDSIQNNNMKGNKYANYLVPEYKKAIYVLQNLKTYGEGNAPKPVDQGLKAKA